MILRGVKGVWLGDPLSGPRKIGPPKDTPWYYETSWSRFGCFGSTRLGGVNGHKNITDKEKDKERQRDIV